MKSRYLLSVALMLLASGLLNFVFGHCDTMDGPVVADARKAIDQNNVNYVLKWVQAVDEKEIREVFDLTMKVRGLNEDARKISDRYFFETVVRIHRSGEGMPYTGIKPEGTSIDEKIRAADESLVSGDLAPLEKLVSEDRMGELKKRFDKAMSLRNFDVNDVRAGRAYIAAYVQFFHFVEGEAAGDNHEHSVH